MPVDALKVPPNATADQKIYALALATISQYANAQGSTLAAAAATLQACLASPSTNCSPGGSTLGALLASAMSTFEGNYNAFGGSTLPVANFGSVTSTGSNAGGNSGGAPLSLLAGVVTGTGSSNGPGAVALFTYPSGTAVDAGGNIYVVDSGSQLIRKITPAGIVSTLAGTPGVATDVASCTSSTCGDGPGVQASFNNPQGITYDPVSQNLYVVDCGSSRIRKVTLGGVVATLAGAPASSGTWQDGPYGTLQCSASTWTNPITTDGAGNVWIVDGSGKLRVITPTPGAGTPSNITSVIGTGGTISGLAFDHSTGNPTSGKILMADSVHRWKRRDSDGHASGDRHLCQLRCDERNGDSGNIHHSGVHRHLCRQRQYLRYPGRHDELRPGKFSLRTRRGGRRPRWQRLCGQSRQFDPVHIHPLDRHAGRRGQPLRRRDPGSADGPAASASFNDPEGLSTDSSGNIYLAECTTTTRYARSRQRVT